MAEFKALQFEKLDTKRELQLLLGRTFGVPDIISTEDVRFGSVARELVARVVDTEGKHARYEKAAFAAGLMVAEQMTYQITAGGLDGYFMDFMERDRVVRQLDLSGAELEDEAWAMAAFALDAVKAVVRADGTPEPPTPGEVFVREG